MTVRKIPHRNIALVLAAALLSASAATAQVAPRLPDSVFGRYWCFSHPPKNDPHLILPADSFDDCANRGGARFWQRGGKSGFQLGRFDWRADCEISKIDRIGSKYQVHSYCRAKREMFVRDPLESAKHFELWQSKTGMHWRELELEEQTTLVRPPRWNAIGGGELLEPDEHQVPPPEYDKPFVGKLTEFIAKDEEEFESFCRGVSRFGCARYWPASKSGPPLCDIYLAPDELLRRYLLTTEMIRRHEIAHCNGWRHPASKALPKIDLPKIDPWSLKVGKPE